MAKTNRNTSTLSGAKAIFKINGQTIAHAQNCSYDLRHNLQPVEVIGNEFVAEHCELGVTVEFTCSIFRVYNKSARSLGLQPKLSEILLQDVLVVEIQEKQTGNVLIQIDQVKMSGRSGTLDARGMFTETLTFVGKTMIDETDIADGDVSPSGTIPTDIEFNNPSDT